MLDLKNIPPRLKRIEASAYLMCRHGISRTPGTLAKLAVVGGGPSFRKVGARTVLYDVDALDTWAAALLGPVVNSTSELAYTKDACGLEGDCMPSKLRQDHSMPSGAGCPVSYSGHKGTGREQEDSE